jgi:hypothetical protein
MGDPATFSLTRIALNIESAFMRLDIAFTVAPSSPYSAGLL